MRWWCRAFCVAAVIASLLQSSRAYGAEPLQLTPKIIVVEGKKGLWFPEEQSARILERLELAGKQELLIDAQEKLIRKQEEAILTATTTIDLQLHLQAETSSYAADLITLVNTTARQRDEAVEKLDAWYRSPGLWYSTGIVTTLVAGVAFVILTK